MQSTVQALTGGAISSCIVDDAQVVSTLFSNESGTIRQVISTDDPYRLLGYIDTLKYLFNSNASVKVVPHVVVDIPVSPQSVTPNVMGALLLSWVFSQRGNSSIGLIDPVD